MIIIYYFLNVEDYSSVLVECKEFGYENLYIKNYMYVNVKEVKWFIN